MNDEALIWWKGKRVAVTVSNSDAEYRGVLSVQPSWWPWVGVGHVTVNANFIVTVRELEDAPF